MGYARMALCYLEIPSGVCQALVYSCHHCRVHYLGQILVDRYLTAGSFRAGRLYVECQPASFLRGNSPGLLAAKSGMSAERRWNLLLTYSASA